jgi:hypothetical protein
MTNDVEFEMAASIIVHTHKNCNSVDCLVVHSNNSLPSMYL